MKHDAWGGCMYGWMMWVGVGVGVTWGWERDPQREGWKSRKRGEWGHVLSFLN